MPYSTCQCPQAPLHTRSSAALQAVLAPISVPALHSSTGNRRPQAPSYHVALLSFSTSQRPHAPLHTCSSTAVWAVSVPTGLPAHPSCSTASFTVNVSVHVYLCKPAARQLNRQPQRPHIPLLACSSRLLQAISAPTSISADLQLNNSTGNVSAQMPLCMSVAQQLYRQSQRPPGLMHTCSSIALQTISMSASTLTHLQLNSSTDNLDTHKHPCNHAAQRVYRPSQRPQAPLHTCNSIAPGVHMHPCNHTAQQL